ncbi:cation:proton antiporter [Scleromatobacter humisilvae]|uniref:Sodium:proton antiporter n=1 Tax=Scleromatobacter humisilvae TaxID=2897159 RepID=A0A9X1YN80_9BURK|nr:sodium:proton antiporter [Scleromatobacter humisilvae]MCK9689111.1 sodium:proton antiporter [Scleromatobacter humisilvae]
MLDIAASLLVLTALLSYVNQRWLRLPMTIGVMATSLLLSLALVALDAVGLSGGLRAREQGLIASIDFSELLMQGMLSLLLFAGALHVDVRALHDYRWQVGVLAFVGTAMSTVVVGVALWLVIGLVGLPVPLLECLLFGALISPTDPIAVIGMLKSAGAPRNLEVVIAGESLFNDGVGVVIFSLLLGMASTGGTPTLGHAGMLLLREAGGGLVYGWALGFATYRLLRSIDHYQVEVLLMVAAVVGGYALANHLHVSGPLAMVVAGLFVGSKGRAEALSPATRKHVDLFWELLDEILNAVLFVLVGMEVVVIHLPLRPVPALVAGVAAIAITLAARWLTVGWPVVLAKGASRLPPGAGAVLTWGGLRGGISIALALSLPAGPWRETLIALTYCVVAFSILVQGLTFGRLVRATLRADA